jgi:transcriptional regulator with XRE-family HTH domain
VTGAELRSAREAAGVTLYEVPRRMPVSTLRWHRIEAGLDAPTAQELADFEQVVKSPATAASTPAWANTATSPTSPRSRAA